MVSFTHGRIDYSFPINLSCELKGKKKGPPEGFIQWTVDVFWYNCLIKNYT